MTIRRVAAIFDDRIRPDTTGVYVRRALAGLVEVVHFRPEQAESIPRHGLRPVPRHRRRYRAPAAAGAASPGVLGDRHAPGLRRQAEAVGGLRPRIRGAAGRRRAAAGRRGRVGRLAAAGVRPGASTAGTTSPSSTTSRSSATSSPGRGTSCCGRSPPPSPTTSSAGRTSTRWRGSTRAAGWCSTAAWAMM